MPDATPPTVSPTARSDLSEVWQYGAAQWSEHAADAYLESLFATFDLLALQPQLGRLRTGRRQTARVLFHRSHVILYEVTTDGTVGILRVRHQREAWVRFFQ